MNGWMDRWSGDWHGGWGFGEQMSGTQVSLGVVGGKGSDKAEHSATAKRSKRGGLGPAPCLSPR